jgi:hypothetical protein
MNGLHPAQIRRAAKVAGLPLIAMRIVGDVRALPPAWLIYWAMRANACGLMVLGIIMSPKFLICDRR